jgi:hypothetical protein
MQSAIGSAALEDLQVDDHTRARIQELVDGRISLEDFRKETADPHLSR